MSQCFTRITKCRVCGSSELTEVISMKPQYLSATFVESNDSPDIVKEKVPLTVLLCASTTGHAGCGHVQLKEEVQPEYLYKNYFYRSSANEKMKADLNAVVDDLCGRVKINAGDIVLDIGANDGTSLQFYPSSANRIGVEPAQNIDWSRLDPSIKMVNDYFSYSAIADSLDSKKVKALTSIAMFYDLPNPNDFVQDVKKALSPDGLWCNQLSYLPAMLDSLNFYDICHEHLSYYSFASLEKLLNQNDLQVVDVTAYPVNGGSLRVFITHSENNIYDTANGRKNIENLRKSELSLGLEKVETYRNYEKRISELGEKICGFIAQERSNQKQVLGLGASTKGNVLLQCFGVTKEIMPYISEINPDKVGLRTLGTDFELISEEKARDLKPSTMLVLPWYFKDSIVKRETNYLQAGGKLLIPMPYAHVISKEGETRL